MWPFGPAVSRRPGWVSLQAAAVKTTPPDRRDEDEPRGPARASTSHGLVETGEHPRPVVADQNGPGLRVGARRSPTSRFVSSRRFRSVRVPNPLGEGRPWLQVSRAVSPRPRDTSCLRPALRLVTRWPTVCPGGLRPVRWSLVIAAASPGACPQRPTLSPCPPDTSDDGSCSPGQAAGSEGHDGRQT